MTVNGDSVEVELRVGMLDLALAKLMTEDHHTIEFPTILLPENVEAGSIIKLQCSRALKTETADKEKFDEVQQQLLSSFATNLPTTPVLRARNVTQTSVVLEWDPIEIATADLHFMALYKGSQRLGVIPQPLKRTVTKVSNLEIDSPYDFHLILSTSAGDFESNKLNVKTHKMTDLTGVVVCIGSLAHSAISQSDIEDSLQKLGAKPPQDSVKLDTTHFICSTEGGPAYERASELNIPIVRPEWLKACENERRLVSVRGFYLSEIPSSSSISHVPVNPVSSSSTSLAHAQSNAPQPKATEDSHTEELSEQLENHQPHPHSQEQQQEMQQQQQDLQTRENQHDDDDDVTNGEQETPSSNVKPLPEEQMGPQSLDDNQLQPLDSQATSKSDEGTTSYENQVDDTGSTERKLSFGKESEATPNVESLNLDHDENDPEERIRTQEEEAGPDSHDELSSAINNVANTDEVQELYSQNSSQPQIKSHNEQTPASENENEQVETEEEVKESQEERDVSTEQQLEKELESDPSAELKDGEQQQVTLEKLDAVETPSADSGDIKSFGSSGEDGGGPSTATTSAKKGKKGKKNKKK